MDKIMNETFYAPDGTALTPDFETFSIPVIRVPAHMIEAVVAQYGNSCGYIIVEEEIFGVLVYIKDDEALVSQGFESEQEATNFIQQLVNNTQILKFSVPTMLEEPLSGNLGSN